MTRQQVINMLGERVLGGERPGQALFNSLAVLMPEVAESIRATDADPFYEVVQGARFKRATEAMDAALAAQGTTS